MGGSCTEHSAPQIACKACCLLATCTHEAHFTRRRSPLHQRLHLRQQQVLLAAWWALHHRAGHRGQRSLCRLQLAAMQRLVQPLLLRRVRVRACAKRPMWHLSKQNSLDEARGGPCASGRVQASASSHAARAAPASRAVTVGRHRAASAASQRAQP